MTRAGDAGGARAALPHVVIVGGGFAGLWAARALARAPARVTLVDRRNHHLFQPLLYQVATAVLNPSDIAAPLRAVLRRQRNTTVLLADAVAVDVAARRLVLADGEITYDRLIVATGASHTWFGHDDWAPHAPGLKTVEDALEVRRRVLAAFEMAEREDDAARRRAWLTFVIVGAGPTGVELAGALAEIARRTLAREFRRADPSAARVVLVEGLARVLPGYPEDLSARAARVLVSLGVDVRTGARVSAVDAGGVTLGSVPDARDVRPGEERIDARTVVWAAGVAASPLARSLGAPLDRAGRVCVTPELTLPGRDDVFVAGDLASLEQGGSPVPGLAPAAMQAGTHAARNVLHALRGRPLVPFTYFHKGAFAVIGRGAAVGELHGGVKLSGPLAWLAWLVIHVFFLIGFRNRVLVVFHWAYSYFFTWRRGVRLITGPMPTLKP
jgi:NADH dehydrogenase